MSLPRKREGALHPAPAALLAATLLLLAGCGLGDDGGGGSLAVNKCVGAPGFSGSGTDPLLGDQWHLNNTGQNTATPGEDANVFPVWNNRGFFGAGVRVAVVDDGLEVGHEDLVGNVALREFPQTPCSHDYVDGDDDPTGGAHGTAVAGVIASGRDNGLGGAGAAPAAELSGYNLLQDFSTANESDALTRDAANIFVSNNSWGPTDLTGEVVNTTSTAPGALDTGVTDGRGGRGIVYMWAAGNGNSDAVNCGGSPCPNPIDNSNYDGYANNRYTMAVCAVGDDGVRAPYSEKGANLLVCAPSQGASGQAITTTDRTGDLGYNTQDTTGDYSDTNYTNTFNGTSSAAPLAAGVVALVLEANPQLTWRDVRIILAESARQNDSGDTGWVQNNGGTGHFVNHQYGFGVVDADAAVALAETWTNVGSEVVYDSGSIPASATFTNGGPMPQQSHAVSGSGITEIEFIELTVDITHGSVGDLTITLTNGTTSTASVLMETHDCVANGTLTECSNTLAPWTFGTVRHLDEAADVTWNLDISDAGNSTGGGTLNSWQLTIYGH